MAVVKPDPAATHVMFHSYDGYSTNVPLQALNEIPRPRLIYGGQPLERIHGGPVRGWVPTLYAWKSAKWVKGVEFMLKDKRRLLGSTRLPQPRRPVERKALLLIKMNRRAEARRFLVGMEMISRASRCSCWCLHR